MSLATVASKLGIASSFILAAAIGNQLRKQQNAGFHNGKGNDKFTTLHVSEKTQKDDAIIMEIFNKLKSFTVVNGCADVIAKHHTERAQKMCQQYLQTKGLVKESAEAWQEALEDRLGWDDGDDYTAKMPPLRPAPPSYSDALTAALTAVWLLSTDTTFCRTHLSVNGGVLGVLRGALAGAGDATVGLVLRITANILAVADDVTTLTRSGLIKEMERFQESNKSEIFLPAWRGFLNLQSREGGVEQRQVKYQEGVYPYVMPNVMEPERAEVDVVLIHGIQGGAELTWRQHDTHRHKPLLPHHARRHVLAGGYDHDVDEYYTPCWPLDWLVPALPTKVRVLAVDYEATWWHWGSKCQDEARGSVANHSRKVSEALVAAGVGGRPVVWLAHSMGGLILKDMLMNDMYRASEAESSEGRHKSVAELTRGVVFFSVPHQGSPLASSVTRGIMRLLLNPSTEVFEMREDSPVVERLHESFVRQVREHDIGVLTLNESQPTTERRTGLNVFFVPPHHGVPGVGELYEADACHIDICKPHSRHAESYKKVLEFIKHILQKS